MTTAANEHHVKVTLSLPEAIVAFADLLAKNTNSNRSRVIAGILRQAAEEEKECLMIEGYKALAEHNKEFAESSMAMTDEALPEWD